jgi:hypothetical protein
MDFKKDTLLSEIYNIDCENLTTNCPLDIWFKDVVQKTYAELTMDDVSTMLTQDIFTEMALQKAVEILLSDPTAGIYPLQLLEFLCSQPIEVLNGIDDIKNIFSEINRKLEAVDLDIVDLEDLTEIRRKIESAMNMLT